MKGQATTDNEAGERKLAVKNPMKGQTTMCQDSPLNKAMGHNKIGKLS